MAIYYGTLVWGLYILVLIWEVVTELPHYENCSESDEKGMFIFRTPEEVYERRFTDGVELSSKSTPSVTWYKINLKKKINICQKSPFMVRVLKLLVSYYHSSSTCFNYLFHKTTCLNYCRSRTFENFLSALLSTLKLYYY